MKRMKGGRSPQGYTIVEVMLFLAISSFMFVIAANFVNGKQQTAEFRQSMNDITTQMRGVIEDVSNGRYTTNDQFSCTASAGGLNVVAGATKTQGSNKGCVYMGKVLRFNKDSSSYSVITVLGRQFASGTGSAFTTQFGRSLPEDAYQLAPAALIETRSLQWGNTVTKIIDDSESTDGGNLAGCPKNNQAAIGFFGSFGKYTGVDVQSGAQSVVVTCVPTTNLNASNDDFRDSIANQLRSSSVHGRTNFKICFNSGTGQVGSVMVGGKNGQQVSVRMQIGDQQCA